MMSQELAAALQTIHDLAIGSQAQFISLQNTLNVQAQAITEMQQRIISSEQMWHASHSEVHGRIRQIEAAGTPVPAGRGVSLIDTKSLVPDSFSGEKHGGMSWRDWSHRVRSHVGTQWPKLRNLMERVEQRTSQVTDADITDEGIEASQVEALKYVLIARTTGQAHTVLRQDDTANGLEAYRRLAQFFEPDTESRNLHDIVQILNPELAKSIEDFSRKFPLWKAAYQTRLNRVGPRAALDDDLRKTIWIQMLPRRDREDVMRHRHLWRDADALDRNLLQIIVDRTRSPTQAAFQVDAEEDEEILEVDSDTGDTSLFRIEAKTGKKKFVKTFPRKRLRDLTTVECYRCGRLGHYAGECTHDKHKNGGPVQLPKPKADGTKGSGKKRAEAGSCEDQESLHSRDHDLIPLAGIELCGLEVAADPLQTNDPWRTGRGAGKGSGTVWQRRFDLRTPPEAAGRYSQVAQLEGRLAPKSAAECELCRAEGIYDLWNHQPIRHIIFACSASRTTDLRHLWSGFRQAG